MKTISNIPEKETQEVYERLIKLIRSKTKETCLYGKLDDDSGFALYLSNSSNLSHIEPSNADLHRQLEILQFILKQFEMEESTKPLSPEEEEIFEIVDEIRLYEPQGEYNINHPTLGLIIITIDEDGYDFELSPAFEKSILLEILAHLEKPNKED